MAVVVVDRGGDVVITYRRRPVVGVCLSLLQAQKTVSAETKHRHSTLLHYSLLVSSLQLFPKHIHLKIISLGNVL